MERTYTEEEQKAEEQRLLGGVAVMGAIFVGAYTLGGVVSSSRTRHNHNRYIKGYKSGYQDAQNNNVNKL